MSAYIHAAIRDVAFTPRLYGRIYAAQIELRGAVKLVRGHRRMDAETETNFPAEV